MRVLTNQQIELVAGGVAPVVAALGVIARGAIALYGAAGGAYQLGKVAGAALAESFDEPSKAS